MFDLLEVWLGSKGCLLITVMAGGMLGYFYKKAQEKAYYLPIMAELNQKIKDQVAQRAKLTLACEKLSRNLSKDRERLQHMTQKLQRHHAHIQKQRKRERRLEKRHHLLTQTYQEKSDILNYYENEIERLKSACRIESAWHIEEDRKRLQTVIIQKRNLYNQVCDNFNRLHAKVERIMSENRRLRAKSQALEKQLKEKHMRYHHDQADYAQLQKAQAQEYHDLQQSQEKHAKRLKQYREKIEALRTQVTKASR